MWVDKVDKDDKVHKVDMRMLIRRVSRQHNAESDETYAGTRRWE